jgi:hypothetical protein
MTPQPARTFVREQRNVTAGRRYPVAYYSHFSCLFVALLITVAVYGMFSPAQNTRMVGLNPTRNMDVCFCVFLSK